VIAHRFKGVFRNGNAPDHAKSDETEHNRRAGKRPAAQSVSALEPAGPQ
jgi:hypothetical protein